MRLDKFLKVSRLIKRRTLAKRVADEGRIQVNGRPAKASTKIAVHDQIEIKLGKTLLTIRVKDLREDVRKDVAQELYEIIQEKKILEE